MTPLHAFVGMFAVGCNAKQALSSPAAGGFPSWPQYFSRKGTQINSFKPCPYEDDTPSLPFIETRMESYYDW
jgi:hypothetical protein